MAYIKHFTANIRVALKAGLLMVFHIAHAIIPIKYTDHEYWDYGFHDKDKN